MILKQKTHRLSGSGAHQIAVIKLEPDRRAGHPQRSKSQSKVQLHHHDIKLGLLVGWRQMFLQG